MDLQSFANGISFAFLQPHMTPSTPIQDMLQCELLNTQFPENNEPIKSILKRFGRIPRMSTLALGGMIQKAVSDLDPQHAFVNVGVWHGFTLLSGMANNPHKTCIGIDNFSEFGGPRKAFMRRFLARRSGNHYFYEMDYKKYFIERHNAPIGFYIFDGPHDYQNQLSGLQLAEPYFADHCIVMVDDTNWDALRQATLDFIAGSVHDYRILFDVKTAYNGHPTFWNGVIVFQRV